MRRWRGPRAGSHSTRRTHMGGPKPATSSPGFTASCGPGLAVETRRFEAAWPDFREEPDKCSYDELMKLVPKTGRTAWHEKAMDAAKGTDLRALIELFIETKEMERLAEL